METAAGDMKGQTTINKKMRYHGYYIWEGVEVFIAMIWQCLQFSGYVARMRYPEIHQNKINQCSYWFSDPHKTNPIQLNNQLVYGSNKWWGFWVWNRFNEWCVVFCCCSIYKIRWTKFRCQSWCIKCMIIWLLHTIRIYSNDSKEEINMIINTYIYVITR